MASALLKLGGKRSDLFHLSATVLQIAGVDFEVPANDPRVDERTALLTRTDPFVIELADRIFKTRKVEPVSVLVRDNMPTIVKGRHRTFCTRLANERCAKEGLEEILVPCLTVQGTDEELMVMALVENSYRRDDPPVTLANKIHRLKNVHKWSTETIGNHLRITSQSVRNTLSLLKLEPSLATLVNNGTLGPTVGYEIAKLSHEEQLKLVEALGARGKIRKIDAQVAVTNVLRQLAAGAEAPSNDGDGVIDAEFDDAAPKDASASAAPAATSVTATPAGASPAPSTGTGSTGTRTASGSRPAAPAPAHVPPGLRDFKALLTGLKEGTLSEDSLPEDVWRTIRWAAGDLSALRIAGLSQALKIMGRPVG